jgi:hypothetical protein
MDHSKTIQDGLEPLPAAAMLGKKSELLLEIGIALFVGLGERREEPRRRSPHRNEHLVSQTFSAPLIGDNLKSYTGGT